MHLKKVRGAQTRSCTLVRWVRPAFTPPTREARPKDRCVSAVLYDPQDRAKARPMSNEPTGSRASGSRGRPTRAKMKQEEQGRVRCRSGSCFDSPHRSTRVEVSVRWDIGAARCVLHFEVMILGSAGPGIRLPGDVIPVRVIAEQLLHLKVFFDPLN